MNIQQCVDFFLWMTLLNFGLLIFSTIMILLLQKWVLKIHHTLFAITEGQFHAIVYSYLGAYKLLWIIFCLTPYIALRIISA